MAGQLSAARITTSSNVNYCTGLCRTAGACQVLWGSSHMTSEPPGTTRAWASRDLLSHLAAAAPTAQKGMQASWMRHEDESVK